MTDTNEGNVCRGCYDYCFKCSSRQHPKGMAADKICNSCAENMNRCEACENYIDEYDTVSCVECGVPYCDWCSDQPENMTRTEDDEEPICRDCAPVKSAETFEAPYAGSGSLFSVGSSDSLSGLSSKELTESSAIHGDFDSASLNYSGHQNLQVRAETTTFNATAYSMIEYQDDDCLKRIADSLRPKYNLDFNEGYLEWDYDLKTGDMILYIYDGNNKKLDEITYDRKALAKALKEQGYRNPESWGAETFESMSWYDPGEDTNNLERAFRREYPRYTLDSGSMEYLIYQGGASNKFHIFFVAQDDGGQYHAFNAYGRIGYNPRIQYIGGPYSTKASAEYAFGKKMGQKTKKGYRPFGAEGSGDICTVCGDTAVHFYKDGEVILCDKHYQQQYGKYSAEELSVKEPFQTGFKLTLGVISAGVVGTLGLSALGMILTGLRNGDE